MNGMVIAGLNNKFTKMRRYKYSFISVLMLLSCCSGQFRFEFDKNLNAVKTCSDNPFQNLTILEKGESLSSGFKIYLIDDNKGSQILFLEKKNPGYKTSDGTIFKFMPNKQYIITSTFLDSRAKMTIFTNQYAQVDSIINPFRCK